MLVGGKLFDFLRSLDFFSQSTCYAFLESLGVGESKLHGCQFFFGHFGLFFGQIWRSQAKIIGTKFNENFSFRKYRPVVYFWKALKKLRLEIYYEYGWFIHPTSYPVYHRLSDIFWWRHIIPWNRLIFERISLRNWNENVNFHLLLKFGCRCSAWIFLTSNFLITSIFESSPSEKGNSHQPIPGYFNSAIKIINKADDTRGERGWLKIY